MQRLEAYTWPGNVRELRNAIARRVALGELVDTAEPTFQGADPDVAQSCKDVVAEVLERGLPLSEARRLLLKDLERRYVKWMLEAHGGNVRKAASAAGVARRYFQILHARTKQS